MTIRDALSLGIDTADAEILLAFALQKDRTWVLAHPEQELSEEERTRIGSLIERRRAWEPVAYITGRKDFYGRTFIVTPSVLIPRPATERLVEIALDLLRGDTAPTTTEIDSGIVAWADFWGDVRDARTIVDIGTGSGCIAVTLACELPDVRIIATDVSADALAVAKQNAQQYHVDDRIRFVQGRGLDPIATLDETFLIVSNPPYIPEGIELQKDVEAYEPHEALFAGADGRDVIASIVLDAKKNPHCIGFVMECRSEQAPNLIPPASRPT